MKQASLLSVALFFALPLIAEVDPGRASCHEALARLSAIDEAALARTTSVGKWDDVSTVLRDLVAPIVLTAGQRIELARDVFETSPGALGSLNQSGSPNSFAMALVLLATQRSVLPQLVQVLNRRFTSPQRARQRSLSFLLFRRQSGRPLRQRLPRWIRFLGTPRSCELR